MTEVIKITVNLDNSQLADLRLFESLQAGEFKADDVLEFFNRVVIYDGDIEKLPLTYMRAIIDEVSSAMMVDGTEKN